jgi:voltage-gated potassium channel
VIGWRRWVHLGLIMAVLVVAYFVVPVSNDLHRTTIARGAVTLLSLAALAYLVVRQLRLHLDDHRRKLDGLIVVIVLVMMVFSFSFYAIEQRDPTQFDGLDTRLDALYFTMASAATVGFGDVHAAGQFARGMVLTQMVFNVVFVGTAVALLSARIRAAATERAQTRTTQRKPK